MKQQNSRMIAEVNKIIGNSLMKDGGVYLPKIGSLSVTTTPPSLSGANAPQRTVEFTTEERHRSLIITISERGNCTEEQAAIIYKKWRKTSTSDSKIEIEGVGSIVEEVFTPSPALITKLNPVVIKSETKRAEKQLTKPKGGISKGVLAAIFATAAAAIIGLFLILSPNDQPTQVSQQITTNAAEVESEPSVDAEEVEPTPEPTPEPVIAAPKAEPKANTKTTQEIVEAAFKMGTANSNLRYKVVYGAFSTKENIARAIITAENQADNTIKCTAYNHGKSYIVSLYDTNDIADAQRFVNEHKDLYKESLWIHKR